MSRWKLRFILRLCASLLAILVSLPVVAAQLAGTE